MTTTLEKYAGQQAHNYCTLPQRDVPILNPLPVCQQQGCGRVVVTQPTGKVYPSRRWVHADSRDTDGHSVWPRPSCDYCGTNDAGTVHNRQYAWYNATECDRCGGVSGYPIGD